MMGHCLQQFFFKAGFPWAQAPITPTGFAFGLSIEIER
jgi:hypothetical protein